MEGKYQKKERNRGGEEEKMEKSKGKKKSENKKMPKKLIFYITSFLRSNEAKISDSQKGLQLSVL